MFLKKLWTKEVLNKCLIASNKSYKTLFKTQRYLCSSVSSQPLSDSSTNNTVEDKPQFPGSRSKWTENLEFIVPEQYEGIPVYRVLDRNGLVMNPSEDPNLSQEMITKIYKGLHRFQDLPKKVLTIISKRDDYFEFDGQSSVRIPKTGKDFLLYD